MTRRERLAKVRLYVLTGREWMRGRPWEAVVQQALEGGAQMVQLREKMLSDGELLFAARRLRELTNAFGALMIVNDRPDIALLSDADGVHIGQEDLPVAEVRKLIGPDRLIGVSTHAVEQARRAAAEGADMIGVGPIFATPTKVKTEPPVTFAYARRIAELRLGTAAFAIGGLEPRHVPMVLEAGLRRVAAVRGVIGADDPRAAAQHYLRELSAASLVPGL